MDTWQYKLYDIENFKAWDINVRIISLQCGARPEGWTIQVSDPISDAVAELFGEFWGTVERAASIDTDVEVFDDLRDAVEQLTRRIPGMWDADEDEEEKEEKGSVWPVISPERLLQLQYMSQQKEKQERRARFDESRLQGRNWYFATDSDEDLDE